MPKIYCDSSTKEACFIVEGQKAVVLLYPVPVTVNVGEYKSVILALEEAKRRKLKQVELLTDSQLVVLQVYGVWTCRAQQLLPLRDKVRELVQDLGAVVGWITREQNLAGKELENKPKPIAKTSAQDARYP